MLDYLKLNPALKKIYVDKKPDTNTLRNCNETALAEYTDMNPARQICYALDKKEYYKLKAQGLLINENTMEGACCLEIWQYNPAALADDSFTVDPLSLYLTLKNTRDERIQMALENIIEKYVW